MIGNAAVIIDWATKVFVTYLLGYIYLSPYCSESVRYKIFKTTKDKSTTTKATATTTPEKINE